MDLVEDAQPNGPCDRDPIVAQLRAAVENGRRGFFVVALRPASAASESWLTRSTTAALAGALDSGVPPSAQLKGHAPEKTRFLNKRDREGGVTVSNLMLYTRYSTLEQGASELPVCEGIGDPEDFHVAVF